MKRGHLKCVHTNKGVVRRQNDGGNFHTFTGKSAQLGTSLEYLCTNACSMANKTVSICICKTTVSVASQRHGGIAHTTNVLPWMDTGFLGRTSQDSGEGGVAPYVRR